LVKVLFLVLEEEITALILLLPADWALASILVSVFVWRCWLVVEISSSRNENFGLAEKAVQYLTKGLNLQLPIHNGETEHVYSHR